MSSGEALLDLSQQQSEDSCFRWNNAIAQHYFSTVNANRPVYLDVEDQILIDLGRRNNISAQDAVVTFKRTIGETLIKRHANGSLLDRQLRLLNRWKSEGSDGYPPYIALLAFFCNVAEGMKRTTDFAAHNYYAPLTIALGLEATVANRKHVRQGFASAGILWNDLNNWLVENEGELGLPTAFPLDRRIHVSLPLSQALLTERDRKSLQDFFATISLRPHQQISPPDMERLLQEWVPTSKFSSLAKALWRKAEARHRISENACIELEAWNGSFETEETAVQSVGSLKLMAAFRNNPRRRLELGLGVRETIGILDGSYQATNMDRTGSQYSAADINTKVQLNSNGSNNWKDVQIDENFPIAEILFSTVEFVGKNGVKLRRVSRRMIVLIYDEEFMRFVESDRVELGQTCLIVAHELLAENVATELNSVARPGFIRFTPQYLPGLPVGWVAFEGIHILSISESIDPDLGPLIPLTWSQLSLREGLSLVGRSVWHTEDPPEVRVAALNSTQAVLSLRCVQTLGSISSPFTFEPVYFVGSTVIDLGIYKMADGDYLLDLQEVKATAKIGNTLSQTSFRLRSADSARNLPTLRRQLYAHDFSNRGEWATLSATVSDSYPHGTFILGSSVKNAPIYDEEHNRFPSLTLPPKSMEVSHSMVSEVEDDFIPEYDLQAENYDSESCVNTGAHQYMLEPVRDRRSYNQESFHASCKICGLKNRFPNRPKYRTIKVKAGFDISMVGLNKFASVDREHVMPIRPRMALDIDLMFDALCYSLTGTWQHFLKIAAQIDDSPWFAVEAARLLSSLGHLELELDQLTLRPKSWSVNPPQLYLVPSKAYAVLTGFRSHEFVEQIRKLTDSLGGKLEEHEFHDSPDVLKLIGLSVSDLFTLAQRVSEVTSRDIKVINSNISQMVKLVSNAEDLIAALPNAITVNSTKVEIYDPISNSWVRTEQVGRPGAYRLHTRPIQYVVFTGTETKVADNRLVKYLAASIRGWQMLAYDETNQTLHCRLGAQLPGLFERAATLCSGEPPVSYVDGTVSYKMVPPEIASQIWDRLRPKEPKI